MFKKKNEKKIKLNPPKPSEFKYEAPPRYLLPSEMKKVKKRKPAIKTIAMTKNGLEAYRKPYRCVQQCIHPESGTIRYQEYLCYPPLHCDPNLYHPPIGRPEACTCDNCNEKCEEGCGCVKACARVHELRKQVKDQMQAELCDLEPLTLCIPLPPRKPPDRICNTCILELRVDEDFNILNDVDVRKHIYKEDKKFQQQKKEYEEAELKRVTQIGRLCPTLHMKDRDIPPESIAKGKYKIHRTGKKPIVYYAKKKRFAFIRNLFTRDKIKSAKERELIKAQTSEIAAKAEKVRKRMEKKTKVAKKQESKISVAALELKKRIDSSLTRLMKEVDKMKLKAKAKCTEVKRKAQKFSDRLEGKGIDDETSKRRKKVKAAAKAAQKSEAAAKAEKGAKAGKGGKGEKGGKGKKGRKEEKDVKGKKGVKSEKGGKGEEDEMSGDSSESVEKIKPKKVKKSKDYTDIDFIDREDFHAKHFKRKLRGIVW